MTSPLIRAQISRLQKAIAAKQVSISPAPLTQGYYLEARTATGKYRIGTNPSNQIGISTSRFI